MSAARCCVVLVTCPDRRHARRIARGILEAKLAACVNIVPAVESLFWWQGKVDVAAELLLIMKTTQSGFDALRGAILQLHPYDVPEIIALPIRQGHAAYLRWVTQTVTPTRRRPARLRRR